MAILINLIYCVGWQPIEGCLMPNIRVLGYGVATKTKSENQEEKTYYFQISQMILNVVSLFPEIPTLSASKYPAGNHPLILQSSLENWCILIGNAD